MNQAVRQLSESDLDPEFLSNFGVDALWHPDSNVRMRHRMTFRNERRLYKRKSSLSGTNIISIYAPDAPYQVYSADEWWSDNWDAESYGRDYDPTRSFFEQFAALQRAVPRIALFNINPYNSAYCQQAYGNKNCYLCSVVKDCEDSMYVTHSNNVKDSYDCDYLQFSELCYDCLDSDKLYSCIGCDHCHSSSELLFCFDCIGCQNCIGCWGLRNQKYSIFNVPYEKAEYEQMRAKINLGSAKQYAHWMTLCRSESFQRHDRREFLVKTEDCVGNNLVNAKNCNNCFDAFEVEECSNCTWIFQSHHAAEVYGMGTSEWVYEAVGVEKLNGSAFNTFVSDSAQIFYSDLCFYSRELFGCVSMRRKKNCILNKEYSPEDYKRTLQTIIGQMRRSGEWGRFFPAYCSPFAYNETVAQERFPLSEAEALELGYRWREADAREYAPANTTPPDDSRSADDAFCKAVLACAATKKNYQLQPAELAFYKRMPLPIPSLCPEARCDARILRRSSKGSSK